MCVRVLVCLCACGHVCIKLLMFHLVRSHKVMQALLSYN